MSLVDDLPQVLSPLSPISPDTLTSVLGRTSPRCDMDYLVGDMRRQETREGDVPSAPTSNTPDATSYRTRTEKNRGIFVPPSPIRPATQKPTAEVSDSTELSTSPNNQTSLLKSLGTQPQFSSLQQALQADLQNSPGTVPHSLLPPPTQSLAAQKIPITSRAAMLQVSFLQLQTLFPASITALKDFYQVQSARMETSRYSQLCFASNTPWLKPSINYYFDLEHHALIDSLECRLEYLKSGVNLTTQSVPSDGSSREVLPTPPPAHTKVPVTKPAPGDGISHIYNHIPSYTVPQALSTSPFLATSSPLASPSNGFLQSNGKLYRTTGTFHSTISGRFTNYKQPIKWFQVVFTSTERQFPPSVTAASLSTDDIHSNSGSIRDD